MELNEKQQVQNEISYFILLSFLKELYKTGDFKLEDLEIANRANADRFGCVLVKIKGEI